MAIPAILQQLVRNNPMMSQIKNMMGMVNSAQNPQAMLNQLMGSNPNMKRVMDAINQAGGDPQKAFYQMAEQMGADPQEILNLLK